MIRTKLFHLSLILLTALTLLVSCQKEINGTDDGTIPINPTNQTPIVGTVWTYRYYWYNSPGGTVNSKVVNYKAKSEETLGGEKWLKIVDVETDTIVYFLKTKPDGLYQYINNSANLLCKYPAAINDTYNTFNGGSTESFTVRGVNDTISTGLGYIPSNKYEGVKVLPDFNGVPHNYIIDLLWYNKNAWIVWKYQYKHLPPLLFAYYLYSYMLIDDIVY